jgi:hypothetical protein
VENAENAQEEARNPLPIDDRKDALDDAADPKDDNALAATDSAYYYRPRLHLRRNDDFDGVNRNHAFDND